MIRKPRETTKTCRHCQGKGQVTEREWFMLRTEEEQQKLGWEPMRIKGAPVGAELCSVGAGADISTTIKEGIWIARELGKPVAFDFNDRTVVCYSHSDADALYREWWKAVYNETPEESFARR